MFGQRGNGATGTHYHDSDCNCTDGYGSCSSPFTDYQSETFCTSESSSNGAAQEYVSDNHLGGGNTNVSTNGNDILISSTVVIAVPDGADPLAFKLGLDSLSPEYNWFLDPKNQNFYDLVGDFFEIQGNQQETVAFCNAAIEAAYNGGEVDVENMLIYDPSLDEMIKSRMSPTEVALFNNLSQLQKKGYLMAAVQSYIYAQDQ